MNRDAENMQWDFFTLFEHAGDAHFVLDEEVFIEYNQAFLRMIGLSSKEQMQHIAPHHISPEYQPDGRISVEKANELLMATLQEGSKRFEWLHQRINGEVFLVEVSLNVMSRAGKIFIYGNWHDIHERKQTEQELHLFRALIESVADGVAIIDLETNITYANPALCAMHGCSPADILGRSVTYLIAPDERYHMDEISHMITTQGHWQNTLQAQRFNDGSTFPSHLSVSLMRQDGKSIAIIAVVRDMTEHYRQEQERLSFQEQIIESQRVAIRELSTPLIPLSQDVLLLPLVGTIDSQRAQQVLEALLEGVALHHARIAIVDITGVSTIDTMSANALIQAARAVRLLGSQVVLTGIGPAMAQTLINLGADLSSIVTRGTLQNGIEYALGGKSSLSRAVSK